MGCVGMSGRRSYARCPQQLSTAPIFQAADPVGPQLFPSSPISSRKIAQHRNSPSVSQRRAVRATQSLLSPVTVAEESAPMPLPPGDRICFFFAEFVWTGPPLNSPAAGLMPLVPTPPIPGPERVCSFRTSWGKAKTMQPQGPCTETCCSFFHKFYCERVSENFYPFLGERFATSQGHAESTVCSRMKETPNPCFGEV